MHTIHISLSPNASVRDVRNALALLMQPWRWREGSAVTTLQKAFADMHGVPEGQVWLMDSGRNALRVLLKALRLRQGDAIALQAYTCVSVPGPVLWAGGTPLYVDIDPTTYTMDPTHLEQQLAAARSKGLTPRAVIIQHTFGLGANLDRLLDIARKHNLFVIEDCAHALGATLNGKRVGTFGDAAIFSFGRDKVISSVFGGALLVQDRELVFALRGTTLPLPSLLWTLQQLLHPPLTVFARALYGVGGKFLLPLLQGLRILSKALTSQEKTGGVPPRAPSRLPNALAHLAIGQLRRIDEFTEQRSALAQHYTESLAGISGITPPTVPPHHTHAWLRYTAQVPDPRRLRQAARRAGIILGDWYSHTIDPEGTDLRAVGYIPGSCPRAEAAAQHSVNLPTNPTIGIPEADRVLDVVRSTLRP